MYFNILFFSLYSLFFYTNLDFNYLNYIIYKKVICMEISEINISVDLLIKQLWMIIHEFCSNVIISHIIIESSLNSDLIPRL